MSVKENKSIVCPECGISSEAIIWESLNADADPDGKKALFEGTLFKCTCPNCGKINILNYPILYSDVTHGVFIYYVNSSDSLKNVVDTIEKTLESDDQLGLKNFRTRIVSTQSALREKAMIFDCGLDDRIIEVIKLFYLSNAMEHNPNMQVKEVVFMVSDDNYYLQFVSPTPLTTVIDKELYSQIAADIAEAIVNPDLDSYLIDIDWAYSVLNSLS